MPVRSAGDRAVIWRMREVAAALDESWVVTRRLLSLVDLYELCLLVCYTTLARTLARCHLLGPDSVCVRLAARFNDSVLPLAFLSAKTAAGDR